MARAVTSMLYSNCNDADLVSKRWHRTARSGYSGSAKATSAASDPAPVATTTNWRPEGER